MTNEKLGVLLVYVPEPRLWGVFLFSERNSPIFQFGAGR